MNETYYFHHKGRESVVYKFESGGEKPRLSWVDPFTGKACEAFHHPKAIFDKHVADGIWVIVDEPVKEQTITAQAQSIETLGVARPILETRKIGKERIELFDDGFPNAIREIVRVMTWAQEVKEYKDHDWKNLPNPENTLSGAGSRHRSDHNIQKAAGVIPMERVDHESKKLHLAHQAFNVLGELELILTGKIQ